MNLDYLFDVLEQISRDVKLKPLAIDFPTSSFKVNQPTVFKKTNYCPDIQRVTFNGDTTIVFFVDGTYCVMKCSAGDHYDRKTAIVYAIAKRMFGKIGKVGKNGKFNAKEIDGAGFGSYLSKIVDSGFDQQLEEQLAVEKKRKAKEDHLTRQKAQQVAAFEKRVNERANQILLERAALDRANIIEDERRNKSCSCSCTGHASKKQMLNESNVRTSGLMQIDPADQWKLYRRPDKPFSKFTTAEKREYWRYHNAKRRAEKQV